MQKQAGAALTVKPSTVTSGIGSASLGSSMLLSANAVEKSKQWQREVLMERIRSHSIQQRSFLELSKSMRMSMLEKRYALDTVEKSNLQKCLDNMQHCIKVTSRQGLVERLESLSRQLGLKFMEDPAGLFISTDMFYLEILVDSSGALTDVKVHHECKIEQQSCSELVNCLNRGDFVDFTAQLEGLSSIYQLNAEPKVKKKAFVAMQAIETDLYSLYQGQNVSKDIQQLLESSSVGLVVKRRGGHPMKLTYFVSPYDLISVNDNCLQPLTLDLVSSKDIGMSVTVNLEASSANKLQILPTVTFVKDANTGVETPAYAPLTQQNSTLLPATFVLRLNKPLPVCSATLRTFLPSAAVGGDGASAATGALEQKTSPTASGRESPSSTIMNLIVQTASEQQLKNSSKGLFVCLPDQTHCYFFTDNKQLKATLVSSVPFTEPAQVPIILAFLRKQALFYSLLSSCVRPQAKMGNDMDTTTILEVNAISFQQISVSLQHPFEESMATVDFSLHGNSVSCNIYALNRNYDLLSINLTKIVQKSLSIPVTLRALLKFWDQERMQMFQRSMGGGVSAGNTGNGGNVSGGNSSGAHGNTATYGNFNLVLGPNDPGGGGGSGSTLSAGVKQDTTSAQRSFLASSSNSINVTAAAGISGYLKFKSEHIKQEDFHESPKSATQTSATPQMQSVEASSLGQVSNTSQQTAGITALATELEIADKYKNIWKDKTANLKNSVSITPIMHGVSSAGSSAECSSVLNPPNMEMKRTGIEIIPLMTQNATSVSSNNTGSNSAATSPSSGSTTITITPINSAAQHVAIKSDKKCSPVTSTPSCSATSKRNLVDSVLSTAVSMEQKEKKRSKKKRDDSPMGPPEKMFSRQNSPATIANPGNADVTRKFTSPSSSPKGSSGGLLGSVSAGTGISPTISTRPSPKHSPVYTSPKHHSTASNSPKSPFGTLSPKHGSSGKPSMSTLKSAAASLSPKGDKTIGTMMPTSVGLGGSGSVGGVTVNSCTSSPSTFGGRSVASVCGGGVSTATVNSAFAGAIATTAAVTAASKNRDKDKVSACIAASSMGKMNTISATTNLQQLKASSTLNHLPVSGSNFSGAFNTVGGGGAGINTATSAATLDAVMRKGAPVSIAVSLMTSTTVSSAVTAPTVAAATHLQHGNTDKLTTEEYRVKQSQEGLKLTINKTSSKTNAFNTTTNKAGKSVTISPNLADVQSATHSPSKKQHTGLKPGVNSGPASKKPTTSPSLTSQATSAAVQVVNAAAAKISSNHSQHTKNMLQKSYSSGNLSTKLLTHAAVAANSGTARDLHRSKLNRKSFERDRERGGSTAALTATSQPATRLDHHVDMMKILQYASPTMAANMEGFMKNLNTKFQIPKLSQRTAAANNTAVAPNNTAAASNNTAAAVVATTATSVINTSTVTTESVPAPTTPAVVTATKLFNTATSNKMTVNLNTDITASETLQVQQSNIFSEQLHQQQLIRTRPPPPPYHAAVAATITAAATAVAKAADTRLSIETPAKQEVKPPFQQQQQVVSTVHRNVIQTVDDATSILDK